MSGFAVGSNLGSERLMNYTCVGDTQTQPNGFRKMPSPTRSLSVLRPVRR
jgi:hypothetical protein